MSLVFENVKIRLKKSCWYGHEKCWFQHDDIENTENEKSTNKEITSKLFDMMETFTQRIINIEKTNASH